jgi:hypothetical protein
LNATGESANSIETNATPARPPIFLNAVSYVNGQFSLQFAGSDTQTYVVETSTNLINWPPVSTNSPSGGRFIFTDTNATDPARYYRVSE